MSDLQQPMYGGARMNAASSTPAPVQTADVSTKPAQRALQNAQEFVSDVAHQYQRMKDFGEQTRLEGQMDTLATEFEQEMTKRLGFARGHELSFYDGDGMLKQSSLNTFVRNYEGKFRGLKGSFVSQEEAAKFGARQQDVMRRVQGRASELLLKGQIQESRQAFEAKLKLAEERKDWKGYEDAVMGGLNAGLLAPDQAELMKEEANKINLGQQFDNLAATNPSGAYDLLDSEGYKNLFSPAELESMRRGLAARRDSDANDFFKSFVLTKPDAGDGKKSKKEGGNALAQSGLFTANEIRWGTLMQAGKGGMVINEIRSEAIDEARSFDPSLSDEGMELAREKYMDKYLRYESIGISKEFLNRQWKAADDLRKTLMTPTLNVKDRLDLLQRSGLLQNQGAFNSVEQKFYNAAFDDSGKWDEGGEYYNRFLGEFDYGGKTGVDLYKKYISNARKKYSDGLKSQITERFNSWRENEGKDATQAEQQIKLVDLTRKITGNRDITFADDGPSLMDQARGWSAKAQKSKFDTLATKQGKAIPWDFSQQEPPIQRVSVGFDTTRKDLPDGILLPRSMMDGVKEGKDAVILTFDNKHLKAATVVGVCEGDSPQLTYAAAQRGRYDFRKSYDLDMRIIKEKEAQPLLRAQEAALPSGKSVKVNEAKLGGLAPYKQAFIDAGAKNGVDPKLLMAISLHETGGGTSSALRNKKNAMGISPNGGGPRSFETVEESIDYAARLLKQHYLNQGLTTIESIGGKYAPTGAENDPGNLNQYWAKGVRKYYNSISL